MLELLKITFSSQGEYTQMKIKREFKVEEPFLLVKDIPHVNEVESQNASFELYKRAYHVLTEAKRVHDFAALCGDESVKEEDKVV